MRLGHSVAASPCWRRLALAGSALGARDAGSQAAVAGTAPPSSRYESETRSAAALDAGIPAQVVRRIRALQRRRAPATRAASSASPG